MSQRLLSQQTDKHFKYEVDSISYSIQNITIILQESAILPRINKVTQQQCVTLK